MLWVRASLCAAAAFWLILIAIPKKLSPIPSPEAPPTFVGEYNFVFRVTNVTETLDYVDWVAEEAWRLRREAEFSRWFHRANHPKVVSEATLIEKEVEKAARQICDLSGVILKVWKPGDLQRLADVFRSRKLLELGNGDLYAVPLDVTFAEIQKKIASAN